MPSMVSGMVDKPQNRIARTLSAAEGLARLREVIGACRSNMTRIEIATEVCDKFGFHDAKGRPQTYSCLTALRRLEGRRSIELPPSQRRGGWQRHPRGTGVAPDTPVDVPAHAGLIKDLRLELVDGVDELREWNELLLREHPQGGQIITGRQLRYFIRSEHGLLGAVGVSSAALHLEARDEWIGWDWDLRGQYLDRIICLSRFLIRPGVQCRNLASRALGLFCKTAPDDMERSCGVRPWLIESFVDASLHTGGCYRAGNWLKVGTTKGRGRDGSRPTSPKDVYLYCLERDFRRRLSLPSGAGAVALEPGDGIDGGKWAENEFGGAPLGDARLAKRLVAIADTKSRDPTEPFSKCAKGAGSDMRGYYRFIEHPDCEAVNMETILEPHVERTIKRMRGQRRVLCPQDSTDLDYTGLSGCVGLGRTGANKRGAKSYGLRLHTTMALDPDGLPLGVINGECLARKFRPGQPRKERRNLPLKEKETYRWLKSVQKCEEIAERLPGTRIVNLMDREGDIFEIFLHWQKTRKIDLLVRACKDRCGEDGQTLFQQIRSAPESGRFKFELAYRRRKDLSRAPSSVELSVRHRKVTLNVPKIRKIPDAEPVQVWMVHAVELNPPPDAEPIEWLLISTEPVEDFEKACQSLREYSCRWRIEEWHKVLKSGCSVEDVIADDVKTIKRVLAISMVIAWRILLMTLLSRKQPELPPQVLFSDLELKVLGAFAAKESLQPPGDLKEAVTLVARLGGYRACKSNPPPGTTALWRGYVSLCDMCKGAALFLKDDTS